MDASARPKLVRRLPNPALTLAAVVCGRCLTVRGPKASNERRQAKKAKHQSQGSRLRSPCVERVRQVYLAFLFQPIHSVGT